MDACRHQTSFANYKIIYEFINMNIDPGSIISLIMVKWLLFIPNAGITNCETKSGVVDPAVIYRYLVVLHEERMRKSIQGSQQGHAFPAIKSVHSLFI